MTHLHQHVLGKLIVNTPETEFLESAFLTSSLVNFYTCWSLKITHSNSHFCPTFQIIIFFANPLVLKDLFASSGLPTTYS